MTDQTSKPIERTIGKSGLDLRWSLTLRVVAVALSCFLVASTFAIYATYRDVRRVNETVADTILRQMQVQLFRIESGFDFMQRFPDWDPVIERVQGAGQCIQYLKPDGSVDRSSCAGFDRNAATPPDWFSSLCIALLPTSSDVTRPITYRDKFYGTLLVTTEPAAVLAAMWKDVSGLLGFTALMIAAVCVLQFIAISRALRPTKGILAGLDSLANGDLKCRLPSFRLVEFERISRTFNLLASRLERTTEERMALAAKLVDGQEQERQRLARELHDELAQSLSAMSAIAASIKATAKTACPTLVPEAERLSRTATRIMKSVRTTLHYLRPPEIDDLGLSASLTALAIDQERNSGGSLRISIRIDDELEALPPTAASHLYRIVQEGLTNVAKHANAETAYVVIGLHADRPEVTTPWRRWLALTIEDDGQGLGRSDEANGYGLGLIGMRERVLALGGRLDVGPAPGHGFRLAATIPFELEKAPPL